MQRQPLLIERSQEPCAPHSDRSSLISQLLESPCWIGRALAGADTFCLRRRASRAPGKRS